MRAIVAITKALGDENRVRCLMALRGRELCVCQLIELLQLAPSTVSKHMSVLKQARLVESRKEGRWMFYRLADKGAPKEVKGALAWAVANLEDDGQVAADAQRLAKILRMDPERLCRNQSRN